MCKRGRKKKTEKETDIWWLAEMDVFRRVKRESRRERDLLLLKLMTLI